MQIAVPLAKPVRRWLPSGGLRPRPLALALLALIVAGVGGVFAYQRLVAPAAPAPAGQVVPVQRGNVSATVSATGSVVATRQAKLVFATTGRIKDIPVNVGDQVTAGQPLAHLVADAAQVKLETAKSQLAEANLKLQQLTEGATPEDIAAAQAAYDAAVAKLNDLQAGPTAADVEAAQAALAQAQASAEEANAKLQTLQSGATDTDRAAALAAVTSAQNTLDSAQAKLDQLQAGATPEDVASARAGLDEANATLRSSQAKLDQVKGAATQADIVAAQAAVDQAQANVTSTRAKLDQVKATTAVPSDVADAQANLAAAGAKLQTAHQNLDQLSAQLEQAQANLAAQQSALAAAQKSAQQTCDKLGDGSAECISAKSKIDGFQQPILQAQQQVTLLSGGGSWDQIGAQKDVQSAQAAYDAAAAKLRQVAAARSVPVDLISAQTAYDTALSQLTSAKAKLDAARPQATADLVAAQSAVDQAKAGVQSAQAKLDAVLRGATNADLVAAQTAVDTARANLESAQAKLDNLGVATPQDLQAARAAAQSGAASVVSARAKLDQLKAGPTNADVQAARSSIAGAQATLATKSGSTRPSDIALQQEAVRQAELAVQQAQIDLDNYTLAAPFDGIVAAIAGNPGEPAPTGTNGFITLVDPRQVRIDVTVDETDIPKVAVGKPAQITFDAMPGRPFRGQVIAVSPNGTLNQGVVTYPVSLSIETRDQVLPAGLTASATIVIDERNDVLVVPSRAVRRQGREQVVEVLGPDGKAVTRAVKTGVQNDQQVEITDGLAEGEQVVIPSTTTRQPNVRGGPGAGPGPGQGPVVVRGG